MEHQVDGREQHWGAAELLPGAGQGVEKENEEQQGWHDVDNIMNLRRKEFTNIPGLCKNALFLREAFKKKTKNFVTNVTLALHLHLPPKCDEKISAFFGPKWPFHEVKIFLLQ